jgi:hypothetical protein
MNNRKKVIPHMSAKKAGRVKAKLTAPGDFGHDKAFILPADAASYEKMVAQICKALWECACDGQTMEDDAKLALASIGITRPKEPRK